MPRFSYQARDRSGQAVSGVLDAPGRKDALRLLAARQLQPLGVSEEGAGAAKPKPAAGQPAKGSRHPLFGSKNSSAPRRSDLLPFLESLHDLVTSGLSAGEAVRLLSTRLKEPRRRALSISLWERISEGAPLSRAMADFPLVFDPETLNLIQAGEAIGSLNGTLERLISHHTERREMRRKLVTAMAYPACIVFVAAAVIVFFVTFLLPRLQVMLESLGGTMPLATQILITGSNFVLHYGLFIAGAAVCAGISFWRWRETEPGRLASDAWLLKLPLVGPFVVAQTVLAFSQTLSVLLENGITAAEALRMTERQIANRVHRRAFNVAIDRVMEGEALSAAIGRTGCLPDLVLDRLTIGENTGNLVPSLKDVARTYQKVISGQLNAFTGLIASAVIVCVFIFAGFIAFAIVSAVLQVSSSFKA